MTPTTDVNRAIAETREAFPFDDYIGEALRASMAAVVSGLREFLPDFNYRRLLDIGCGPMDKTGVLQRLGFQCSAVDDLSDPWHQRDDNIAKIERYAKRIGIEFHRQKVGDYAIPFPIESFDVVCSFSVIEHLHESPRGLLNTMGAYAAPDGLLVITMPNSVNLRKRLSVLRGRTNYPPIDMFYHSIGTWRGHVREYTLAEMVYICKQSGFEVLRDSTFDALDREKLKAPLRPVYASLSAVFPSLRTSNLVVCRKPRDWQPAEEDPEAYRKAIAGAVPRGIA